ncbi:MAG: hypothetical protein J7513_18190 [Solirubrobacteraceae bacterium]|nr:hypothetical protein [Solirubrobacteraceae bacterium]
MTTQSVSHRRERLLALTDPVRTEVPWGKVTIGSLLVAGIFTLIWQGAPTYDPWAWIIWGREIIHGDLVTTTGPSWKPLPMVFTIPFAIFGHAEPDLWLWVSRAFALMGLVAAGQLGARLGGRLAGILAMVALATTPLYYAYGIQGSSEGMLVLVCCLAATEWLDGRRSHAFWWLVAASLLRPEVWLYAAVVGVERLWTRPARLPWVGAAGLVTIAAWLVPEKVGSGAYFRAATRANAPNPDSAAFASSPSLEVLGSMGNLLLWLPAVCLVVAVIVGAWAWGSRTDLIERRVLRDATFLTALALGWVAIVAAMTEAGYAGNPRYLAAPLGLLVPVAIGGLAWTVRVLADRGLGVIGEFAVLAGILVIVLNGASRLPGRTDEISYQAENRIELDQLAADPAMRAAILSCPPIITHPLMIPPVAWTFDKHLDELEFKEEQQGTFIRGRNIARATALPVLPEGVPLHHLTHTKQTRILQTCQIRLAGER